LDEQVGKLEQQWTAVTKSGNRVPTEDLEPRHRLYVMIRDLFNLAELQELTFDLGVFWEHLAGETLPQRVQSLIEFCERNGRLYMLIDKCQRLRPGLEWPTL